MGQLVNLAEVREDKFGKRAKISVSLRRLARVNRRGLTASHSVMRFWLGSAQPQHVIQLLQQHWCIREALETKFRALGPAFNVVNQYDGSQKQFATVDHLPAHIFKADLIQQDLQRLGAEVNIHSQLQLIDNNHKLKELLDYIERASEVYSVALLGVLYMLEDNLCSFGPLIERALGDSLQQTGLQYLTAYQNKRPLLWQLRQSIDDITDFQSQANVVIAATITFDLHRELLDPKHFRRCSNRH